MTTKIPAELSSTPGISDSSNATAITINSSEQVGILQSSPTSNLHIGASGNDAKRELRIDGTNGSGQTFGFITEADGENGRVSFKVGQSGNTPAQQLMIHPDGGICFGTDTAAANALDDYEEGTWTPTISSNVDALTAVEGFYTKIGRMVYISFHANVDPTSTGAAIVLAGLPFTVADLVQNSGIEGTSAIFSDSALFLASPLSGGTTFLIELDRPRQGSASASAAAYRGSFFYATT